MDLVAFIFNLLLLGGGVVFFTQSFGWLMGGIITAIAIISTLNANGYIMVEYEKEEEYDE